MGKAYNNPNVNPNVVGTGEVVDNSLTAADLAPNSVTASELADSSVDSAAIIDDNVTAADIGPAAVGTSEVADGSLTGTDIQDASVAAGDLASGAALGNLAADSLTATQIGPGAVGTSEIADGTVARGDLAASATGGVGLLASRPTASSVPVGWEYVATNVNGGTTYVSDGSSWLQTGASVSGPAADSTVDFLDGSFSTAGNTAVPTGTDTPLFITETDDTSGMHDAAANQTRVTALRAGVFQVNIRVTHNSTLGSFRQVKLWKNGALAGSRSTVFERSGTAGNVGYPVSYAIRLAAGDYIEVVYNQDTGAAANVGGQVEVVRVGA